MLSLDTKSQTCDGTDFVATFTPGICNIGLTISLFSGTGQQIPSKQKYGFGNASVLISRHPPLHSRLRGKLLWYYRIKIMKMAPRPSKLLAFHQESYKRSLGLHAVII
jgi:hypothetical protein